MDDGELIRVAEDYLARHPEGPVKAKTARQYRRIFDRLAGAGSAGAAVAELCRARKRSTYFMRKYAVRHVLAADIADLLRSPSGHPPLDPASRAALAGWLDLGLAIDALGPDCPIPKALLQPRRSKRSDLSGLPPDWRERVLEAMRGSANRLPALVLAVTGCRPAELVSGVGLTLKDGTLSIRIAGAKLGPDKGQPWRRLDYDASEPRGPVADLVGIVRRAGGQLTVAIGDAGAFGSAIAYYSRRAFPRRRRTISPYSFRHAFASDLKKAWGGSDAVSLALGHRCDRTRAGYGQAQMGRGGGSLPVGVAAAFPVRRVRTSPTAAPGPAPK